MKALELDGTCMLHLLIVLKLSRLTRPKGTGEHGVGLSKKKYLVQELGGATVALMCTIKRTLDPDNLFNPGKVDCSAAKEFRRAEEWNSCTLQKEMKPLVGCCLEIDENAKDDNRVYVPAASLRLPLSFAKIMIQRLGNAVGDSPKYKQGKRGKRS